MTEQARDAARKRAMFGHIITDGRPEYGFRVDVYSPEATAPSFCLYFLDSGGGGRTAYKKVTDTQLEWVTHTLLEDAALPEPIDAPVLFFIHIPLQAFTLADHSTGAAGEPVSFEDDDGVVFDALKTMPRARAVFSGHDHHNSFFGVVDGVELVYGRKSGVEAYEPRDQYYGGRVIALDLEARTLSHEEVRFPCDRELINLGDSRVLEWVPSAGWSRVWAVDDVVLSRTGLGDRDPFPGAARTQHIWRSITRGHKLVPLEHDRVLDWEEETGRVRGWTIDSRLNHTTDMRIDPFPQLVMEYMWATIKDDSPHEGDRHRLLYIGRNRVMDWIPQSGRVRIWEVDPRLWQPQNQDLHFDPLAGLVCDHTWNTIRDDVPEEGARHELVYAERDRVIDWVPTSGHVRIWRVDPRVWQGNGGSPHFDPLEGPVTSYTWGTIKDGWPTLGDEQSLVYLGNGRVLNWTRQSGEARVWVLSPRVWGNETGADFDPFPDLASTHTFTFIRGGPTRY